MTAAINSRVALVGLAAVAASGFAGAAILGNDRHGALKVAADVSWNAFLIGALAVIVVGVTTVARAWSAGR